MMMYLMTSHDCRMAYDQYGQPLMVTNQKTGVAHPEWPPLGYNLIVSLPVSSKDFAAQWMAGVAPVQYGMGAVPQMQMPTPTVVATVVEPPERAVGA